MDRIETLPAASYTTLTTRRPTSQNADVGANRPTLLPRMCEWNVRYVATASVC